MIRHSKSLKRSQIYFTIEVALKAQIVPEDKAQETARFKEKHKLKTIEVFLKA